VKITVLKTFGWILVPLLDNFRSWIWYLCSTSEGKIRHCISEDNAFYERRPHDLSMAYFSCDHCHIAQQQQRRVHDTPCFWVPVLVDGASTYIRTGRWSHPPSGRVPVWWSPRRTCQEETEKWADTCHRNVQPKKSMFLDCLNYSIILKKYTLSIPKCLSFSSIKIN
jgi:hypothetical protein